MPVTFKFQFDGQQAAYFAGDIVSGRVHMTVDKPKKIRAVTVQFKGEANVKWSDRARERGVGQTSTSYQTVWYAARETYFENTLYYAGSPSGEVDIAPGEYSYEFQCKLPNTLPSSFEGAYGHIRYTARAVMQRPWKFDHSAKAAFTVVAPLDLNVFPQAQAPLETESSKRFCCLWCKSGPLTLSFKVPNGGYVPGQTIPLLLRVDNASNTQVRLVKFYLTQEVAWHASRTVGAMHTRAAREKTRFTRNEVAELPVGGAVASKTSKSFTQLIPVPPVPPSNLALCSIIDVQYKLRVVAEVDSWHLNLCADVPFLIGTFPLRTGEAAFYPPISASEGPSELATAPPYTPDLPPPSYEECFFKGNNIMDPESGDNEYTMGAQDFTPRYPVWAFNTHDQQLRKEAHDQ